MKGTILNYTFKTDTGEISGDDNNRYTFSKSDWNEDSAPQKDMKVDFDTKGNKATSIYVIKNEISQNNQDKKNYPKSPIAAGLLALFLGGFGAHKFYLGYTGPAILYLLTFTVGWLILWILLYIPTIILAIIAFVEGIIYITKSEEEFHETYVVNKKTWF